MISLIPDRFDAFLAADDGQPVVMLNLLRFKPETGRARYQEYLATAGPVVSRYGAEIAFAGDGLAALAEEDGQSWDAVALVSYPSRRAFADMIADPEYAKANPLRVEALEEAVLQPVMPMRRS